jgi:hypothetical protein
VVEAPQRGGQGRGEAGRRRLRSRGRGGDEGERRRVVEREAAASLGLGGRGCRSARDRSGPPVSANFLDTLGGERTT